VHTYIYTSSSCIDINIYPNPNWKTFFDAAVCYLSCSLLALTHEIMDTPGDFTTINYTWDLKKRRGDEWIDTFHLKEGKLASICKYIVFSIFCPYVSRSHKCIQLAIRLQIVFSSLDFVPAGAMQSLFNKIIFVLDIKTRVKMKQEFLSGQPS